jgi:hypothetical protein
MKKLVIGAAALIASTAFAQSQMKPGLWEITHKTQTSGAQMEQGMAQMQQQMASMPPEQRKMVEEMMARRGVKMGGAAGGGMTVKVCMTKEMVERHEMPTTRGECKTTRQASGGNTMKVAFTCVNPPSSGEGQFTFNSSESYSMKMAVNTQIQGKPETMNMEGSGRWLGADCGDIKPMRAATK